MKKIPSIRRFILLPLSLFAAYIIVSFGALYLLQRNTVDKFIFKELEIKLTSIQAYLDARKNRIEKSAKQMSVDYTELFAATKEGDLETIEWENSWTVDMAGLQGYVYADELGNITCSSYSNLSKDEIHSIVRETLEKNVTTGFGTFEKGAISEYASAIVRNDELDTIGVVLHIGFITSDTLTMKELSDQNGVELFAFQGTKCIANTCKEEINQAELVLPVALPDSASSHWKGKVNFLGEDTFCAIIPLQNTKGHSCGYILIRLRENLTTSILSMTGTFIIILILIILGIETLIARRINSKISKPVHELSDKVSEIANGDLTTQVNTIVSCSEFYSFSTDLQTMIMKFRDVIKPVAESVKTINQSIGQMSEASNKLSDASNRQAAALEEVASAMEEMAAGIRQNADNAIRTNEMSNEVNAMVNHLGETSMGSYVAIRQIARNVKAINSLVSQTNILALNASVEAARAGEQGKGFAVVAKQVGILAERTKQTATEIRDTASASIGEAEQAYHNAQDIAPKIEQMSSLVKEISSASIEQDTGAQQVNQALLDLNTVTQQNATRAEELSANAYNLQQMSKKMLNAIKSFKL